LTESGEPAVLTSEDQIVAALISANAEEQVAQRFAKQARPCVWLKTENVTDEAEIAIGTTKIGGQPDLPAGLAWPIRPPYPPGERAARYRAQIANSRDTATRHRCTRQLDEIEKPLPLIFVAQINLAEAWHAGPLDPDFPRSGLLTIFYDALEAPMGYDPADHVGYRVLFHTSDSALLTRRASPAELTAVIGEAPFAPLRCLAQACLAPLPIETAHFASLNFDETTLDAIQEWWGGGDESMYAGEDGTDWRCHRVGGWPTPLQGDMQTKCALVAAGYYCGDGDAYSAAETEPVRATAGEWLLLAQIGSDEKSAMSWGSYGRLYVWIRRQDLVARRFEAARIILQF
jgi:uncharacterized protein YwqG